MCNYLHEFYLSYILPNYKCFLLLRNNLNGYICEIQKHEIYKSIFICANGYHIMYRFVRINRYIMQIDENNLNINTYDY